MKIREAVSQYVQWRRLHGAKFRDGAFMLQQFCNRFAGDVECDAIRQEDILGFLAASQPLTSYRAKKYGALEGFYRYAISRGYATRSPLPPRDEEPRRPQPAPPYIYSHDELRRLFAAIDESRKHARKLDAYTFRVLLLLLCGSGLRIGEALRLTMNDVNLQSAVLTVRDAKFYKDRLVPIGSQLVEPLKAYAVHRVQRRLPNDSDSTFFACIDGTPPTCIAVQCAFANLLRKAGIHRPNDGRRNPCLHSFRHSFAVNRLTQWYQQGSDVQQMLPALSAYLGHVNLGGTQVYLSMTPELLQQASDRFNHYINGENHE